MGFFDLYRCPNTKCWWNKKGKEGEHCPECGTELKMFGPGGKETTYLIKEKNKLRTKPETISRKVEFRQE
jgi:hypothetical protein